MGRWRLAVLWSPAACAGTFRDGPRTEQTAGVSRGPWLAGAHGVLGGPLPHPGCAVGPGWMPALVEARETLAGTGPGPLIPSYTSLSLGYCPFQPRQAWVAQPRKRTSQEDVPMVPFWGDCPLMSSLSSVPRTLTRCRVRPRDRGRCGGLEEWVGVLQLGTEVPAAASTGWRVLVLVANGMCVRESRRRGRFAVWFPGSPAPVSRVWGLSC